MTRVVVMGVSGTGKSTVGAGLAAALGVPFADGDAFHSAANVAKMAAGVPLTDDDRNPWLGAIGVWLAARPGGGVVACSALKRPYRDALRAASPGTRFVHLVADAEVIASRMEARRETEGHFMPPLLLASQYADLEPLAPDEDGLSIDVSSLTAAQVVATVLEG